MLFSESYQTLACPGEGIYKEKGSKFLGFAFPVTTEEEVKLHLRELRKIHSSAGHHCYAYRLGPDKSAFRYNDDGEPANTGGKPIYGQILSNDLTNVMVVVVRYFGGILLGVGGLINAYRSAAADAIAHSTIITNQIQEEYKLRFDFIQQSAVMNLLKSLSAKITDQNYTDLAEIRFQIEKNKSDQLLLACKQLGQLQYIRTF